MDDNSSIEDMMRAFRAAVSAAFDADIMRAASARVERMRAAGHVPGSDEQEQIAFDATMDAIEWSADK